MAKATQPIKTLSARGSRYEPTTELIPIFLATYPSNQSVAPETTSPRNAGRYISCMIIHPSTGPDTNLLIEMKLGQLTKLSTNPSRTLLPTILESFPSPKLSSYLTDLNPNLIGNVRSRSKSIARTLGFATTSDWRYRGVANCRSFHGG